MGQGFSRPGLHDPALVDGLARLALVEVPADKPSLVDGLGRWLGWTDAIALAAALGATAAAGTPAVAASVEGEAAALVQAEARLCRAIDDDVDLARERDDPAPFRRRCAALQRAMTDTLGPLRQRLRDALAARSADAARLAAVDAVMSQALAAREQALLGLLPQRLERHFERLRRAAREAAIDAATDAAAAPDWLPTFRRDMRQLLHAELALRLQPLQGLLAALREAAPAAAAPITRTS